MKHLLLSCLLLFSPLSGAAQLSPGQPAPTVVLESESGGKLSQADLDALLNSSKIHLPH